MRGVDRFAARRGGCRRNHFHGAEVSANAAGDANISALRALPACMTPSWSGVVSRKQGMVLPPGNPKNVQQYCLTCWYQAQ